MFLSIDIGGTKTLLALFSHCGLCLKRQKFATSPSAEQFLSDLKTNLKLLIDSSRLRKSVKAITVAIPGVVRIEQDFCSFKFGNLPWQNIDLLTPIKDLFNCKVFFANDANLATLYEASRVGRKSGKSIYLTFSTGIGGGIAENGSLLEKSALFEPGHEKYLFKGKSLEWEDIASAKTLAEVYRSPLSSLELTSETLTDLVARLSLGLLDIIETEDPETIIIGGPLGYIFKKLKKALLPALKTALETQISRPDASKATKPTRTPSETSRALERVLVPKFKRARRPTESVIYGAYLYSKQNYKK